MNQFFIKGDTDFLNITLDQVQGYPDSTSHLGGYAVRASLKIKCGPFQVHTLIESSTGLFYQLLQQLKECQANLEGDIYFYSAEHAFNLFIGYDKTGQVIVSGRYIEEGSLKNQLQFEFLSDQSFLSSTIQELEGIAEKYGDSDGIKK